MNTDITPKSDIRGPADIKALVDGFYGKVQVDALLSPVFNDVAKVDWAHHLPTMYRFWEMILFRSGGYQGSPMAKHIPLPIDRDHFQRWLALFTATVDELFAGPKADEAKNAAASIAHAFQTRLGIAERPF